MELIELLSVFDVLHNLRMEVTPLVRVVFDEQLGDDVFVLRAIGIRRVGKGGEKLYFAFCGRVDHCSEYTALYDVFIVFGDALALLVWFPVIVDLVLEADYGGLFYL